MIFRRLADINEDSALLRREFLKYHSSQNIIPKKQIDFSENMPENDLISQIYGHHKGIIFGEEHFDNLSTRFLIKNMPFLANLGVKTLFFEGLMYGLEKGIDGSRPIRESVHDEYQKLIDSALKNKLNVIGLDSKGCKRSEGITRDIFMNSHAEKIIKEHAGDQKWVALVGMMHLNKTYYIDPNLFTKHTVYGLSDLTQSSSIILHRLPENKQKYIKSSQSYQALPAKKVDTDFLVGIHTNDQPIKNTEEKALPNPVSILADSLKQYGFELTYYDVDSHAYKNEQNNYQKAVIFELFNANMGLRDLEQIKFQIKKHAGTSTWLNIDASSNSGKITFSCNAEEISLVTDSANKIFKEFFKAQVY